MSGLLVMFGGLSLVFFCYWLDHFHQARKTKPSDGLVGLICGELRTTPDKWVMSQQRYGLGWQWVKGNISVVYSDFMGEATGVHIDDEAIEISPSSGWALLEVVKPLIKAHVQTKQAEDETRRLIKIVETSQAMLHD